ncbi:hypothetical protein GCM10027067_36070 [Pseudactinotalea suaedae]
MTPAAVGETQARNVDRLHGTTVRPDAEHGEETVAELPWLVVVPNAVDAAGDILVADGVTPLDI